MGNSTKETATPTVKFFPPAPLPPSYFSTESSESESESSSSDSEGEWTGQGFRNFVSEMFKKEKEQRRQLHSLLNASHDNIYAELKRHSQRFTALEDGLQALREQLIKPKTKKGMERAKESPREAVKSPSSADQVRELIQPVAPKRKRAQTDKPPRKRAKPKQAPTSTL